MTITPSTLLSLPVITTGTESGLWGDYVNNGLTQYLDIAIAGGLLIAITTTNVTLTNTAGTNTATGIVSTTAQYAILTITGAKTAARSLILPSSSREYTIDNSAGTSGAGGPFLLTVKGASTSGVTLVDGEKAIVAWNTNTSDYVKIASSVITNLTGTLPVANGGTGATTLTANNVLLGNGTSAPSFVAPSTNGNVLTSNGTTWQSTAPAATGVTSFLGLTGAVNTSTVNSVGSVMVLLYATIDTGLTNGSDYAGSGLRYGTTTGLPFGETGTLTGTACSGTWRCMGGGANSGGSMYSRALFIRIS